MIRHIGKTFSVAAAVALGWSIVHAETKAPSKSQAPVPESALMRAKVASSQKIMEGLVAKDFTEIRRGAEELIRICDGTEWEAHSDSVYAHYRGELIRQACKLKAAADQSNADAAAFAYMNTLTTCINCHEHCREVLKIAHVNRKSKVVPIPTHDSDDAPVRLLGR